MSRELQAPFLLQPADHSSSLQIRPPSWNPSPAAPTPAAAKRFSSALVTAAAGSRLAPPPLLQPDHRPPQNQPRRAPFCNRRRPSYLTITIVSGHPQVAAPPSTAAENLHSHEHTTTDPNNTAAHCFHCCREPPPAAAQPTNQSPPATATLTSCTGNRWQQPLHLQDPAGSHHSSRLREPPPNLITAQPRELQAPFLLQPADHSSSLQIRPPSWNPSPAAPTPAAAKRFSPTLVTAAAGSRLAPPPLLQPDHRPPQNQPRRAPFCNRRRPSYLTITIVSGHPQVAAPPSTAAENLHSYEHTTTDPNNTAARCFHCCREPPPAAAQPTNQSPPATATLTSCTGNRWQQPLHLQDPAGSHHSSRLREPPPNLTTTQP
ncbi:extensin-like [Malania oleifera]|uniref:extensin-like n=1 Tax=Malania oleifera TaxID=397392 RepID=UPI0025ADEA2A|nr:extensin-like [Malania oleifera]